MPKNLPNHWPGQLSGRRWGCPMAPAGQCGWWQPHLPPSPSHPIHARRPEKCPRSPGWKPGMALFLPLVRLGRQCGPAIKPLFKVLKPLVMFPSIHWFPMRGTISSSLGSQLFLFSSLLLLDGVRILFFKLYSLCGSTPPLGTYLFGVRKLQLKYMNRSCLTLSILMLFIGATLLSMNKSNSWDKQPQLE